MSSVAVRQAVYKNFPVRFYVLDNVAYVCPDDLVPIMAIDDKKIETGDEKAWDKVEAGRRIFPYFEFFEWFSEQFDSYEYSDEVVLPDPMPW